MSLRFQFNADKALQAIIWLANQKPGITYHTILKVLFYADKRHLNDHGRPVIGDDYAALEWGPVASTTYDILKSDAHALRQHGISEVPFSVRGSSRHVRTSNEPNMEVFSESDIECLEWALSKYGRFTFSSLTHRTHKEKAWCKAPKNGRMSYEDFLDEPSDEKIQDLRDYAHRIVL